METILIYAGVGIGMFCLTFSASFLVTTYLVRRDRRY